MVGTRVIFVEWIDLAEDEGTTQNHAHILIIIENWENLSQD